jgi:hypothetical protein
MPRELNLVPARLHDSLDMTVKYDGKPVLAELNGAEDCGMAQVLQKPRIAEVNILDASSASLSCFWSLDRNNTRGRIMNEFHKKDSSKLSISNSAASTGLRHISAQIHTETADFSILPILHPICNIEIRAIIEAAVAEKLL